MAAAAGTTSVDVQDGQGNFQQFIVRLATGASPTHSIAKEFITAVPLCPGSDPPLSGQVAFQFQRHACLSACLGFADASKRSEGLGSASRCLHLHQHDASALSLSHVSCLKGDCGFHARMGVCGLGPQY